MPVPSSSTPARLDELLAETSRTFALAIPLLPEPDRGEVTAAYLLFRVADTLEDAIAWPREKRRAELGRLRALLERPRAEDAERLARDWTAEPPCSHRGYRELLSELPRVLEFLGTLSPPAERSIREHLGRTVERMTEFAGRERDGTLALRDLAELRSYCYAVAGIVGEMLTELFVRDRPELEVVAGELRAGASSFGEALQLVNILKDASADRREGRHFLPAGVERGAVLDLARADLRAAGRYCRALARGGAPRGLLAFTALPVLLARATLDRVERDGPGAKVSRAEVAAIVERLQDALGRGGYDDLWGEV